MMPYCEQVKMYQNNDVLQPERNHPPKIELHHESVVLSSTPICIRKVRVLWGELMIHVLCLWVLAIQHYLDFECFIHN